LKVSKLIGKLLLVVFPLILVLVLNLSKSADLHFKKAHVEIGFVQKTSSFETPAPPHPLGVETKEDVSISENDETFDSDDFTDFLASLEENKTRFTTTTPISDLSYFDLSKCKCPIYIRNCSFLI
jgi:hypothetical protein